MHSLHVICQQCNRNLKIGRRKSFNCIWELYKFMELNTAVKIKSSYFLDIDRIVSLNNINVYHMLTFPRQAILPQNVNYPCLSYC